MAQHLLRRKECQIAWLIDIQCNPWQTADLHLQVAFSGQAQMALKAVMTKGQGETVWRRQHNRVRPQVIPVGYQYNRYPRVWGSNNRLDIRSGEQWQIPWQRQHSSNPTLATYLDAKRHRLAMPLRLGFPEHFSA